MSWNRFFLPLLLGAFVSTASADADTDRVREKVSARLPSVVIKTITATPVPGLFEVAHSRGVAYVSTDGRYLLTGKLIDLETREDLTEKTLAGQRLNALDTVPESRMIVFEASAEPRHTISTFTDIDCPYCRKMHREMAQMNADGIRVRYLLYPRAGFPSVSYDKAVSVWCAPDRQAAMTRAKAGEMPDKRDCENPVEEHMALAQRLGLTGTPFTITDTGRVITGYMPADRLIESLDSDKRGAAR